MKHRTALAAFVLLGLTRPLPAEEGMWTPDQLPEIGKPVRALGLRIDPARLTDLTEHPMNAVISLGGCTASFVSPEGLAITNHHCAMGAIQYNSTKERNLIDAGFLAKTRDDELFAGPGRRIMVTVQFDDVTGAVLGGIPSSLHGLAFYEAVEKREKELIADCEKDPGHRCRVASLHGGLQYRLVKQLEIKDVRLVYAPPDSIGNFGGDVDNWMWPRHTGDFAFYRAYVGRDGRPAEPSKDNVPYRPRHVLAVNPEGVREGDFVMVAGYPGSTSRYRLARELEAAFAYRYPEGRKQYDAWIERMQAETSGRPEAALKYAGSLESANNRAKNFQAMMDGFRRSDILDRKRREETALRTWIETRSHARESQLEALGRIEALIARAEATRDRDLHYGFLTRNVALLNAAVRLYRLAREKEKPDAERESGYQERDVSRIREALTRMERTFDPAVDRAVFRRFLPEYAAIPQAQHVEAFDRWFGIQGSRIDGAEVDPRLAGMYAKTTLAETPARLKWMDATAQEMEKSEDPFLKLAAELYPGSLAMEQETKEIEGLLNEHRPRYMEALLAFRQSRGQAIYPDANGTLRVTYGSVRGLAARDGLLYTPFTTLDGVVEKETGQDPFDSPRALLDAARAGRHGRFRDDHLGTVPVNFLTTLDITGGNSGSPTLNDRAELVGLVFDGTYDSVNSTWYFNEKNTRAIHVDIRYILWVMEEIDAAHHLIREMGVAPRRTSRRGD